MQYSLVASSTTCYTLLHIALIHCLCVHVCTAALWILAPVHLYMNTCEGINMCVSVSVCCVCAWLPWNALRETVMSPLADSLYNVRTGDAAHSAVQRRPAAAAGHSHSLAARSLRYILIGFRLWICVKAGDNSLSLRSGVKRGDNMIHFTNDLIRCLRSFLGDGGDTSFYWKCISALCLYQTHADASAY